MHNQNGILSLRFSTDAYAVSLVVCLVVWLKFKILVICSAKITKLYHKISVFTLQKKSLKRISPFHTVQISENSGAFSVWPNITTEKSLHCGVMMGHWTNFTPVLAKLYPKLWGNDEPLSFFSFVWTNYSELKPFSEVVLWSSPVSWHINFICRSYGWGVRARFVIFSCSLPHLTIPSKSLQFYIMTIYLVKN